MDGYKCFYCKQTFSGQEAEIHFGPHYEGEPACLPDKITAQAWVSRVERARSAAIEECAKWLEDMPEHWRTLASDMRAALL